MKPRPDFICSSCSWFMRSLRRPVVDPLHPASRTVNFAATTSSVLANHAPSPAKSIATVGEDERKPMARRELDPTDEVLQELLWTYGPCGQEDAVRDVCGRELEPFVDDMWVDDAGNLIGYLAS